MNVPGGGNVFWQDDWQGRGRIITVDRKLYGFYLDGAYELLPRVRVAAGLNYVYTTEYLKLGLQPSTASYGEVGTKGGGLGFQLATEIAPLDGVPLTIGVDYKHKVRMDLRGDGNFVVPDAFLQPTGTAPAPVDQDVKHVLTYPNVLHAGVAYRVAAPVLVTFDYTFNRYVVYQADLFEGSRGTSIDVPRRYGNGYTFRLGGEVDATKRLQLRAGVLRDISGFRRDTFSPTLPDSNAWAGSVGAGWRFSPDLQANVAFFYALLDKVTTTGAEAMPGTFDTRVWIASVGLVWRTDLGGPR
jgi:long-chain fatty acid transport protein